MTPTLLTDRLRRLTTCMSGVCFVPVELFDDLS